MTDVRDALRWAREVLPFMELNCSEVKIHGDIVAAIGWSTGGTLAMSLGFTASPYGIKPPDVILTFYSPSNYDDNCAYSIINHSIKPTLTIPVFKTPNYPKIFPTTPNTTYDLLDAVHSEPVSLYPLPSTIISSPSLKSPSLHTDRRLHPNPHIPHHGPPPPPNQIHEPLRPNPPHPPQRSSLQTQTRLILHHPPPPPPLLPPNRRNKPLRSHLCRKLYNPDIHGPRHKRRSGPVAAERQDD